MAKSPVSAGRLSAGDWIQAGFSLLAEGGVELLKIDRLCTRLGVTKGSFYWHFKDMASYRAALMTAWGELRDGERSGFADLADLPPRERLTTMMASLLGAQHWHLELAMREWARTDEAAAASVRASDRRVLTAVRQAFLDAGFADEDAELRANATFAVGIGFLHVFPAPPNDRLTDQRQRLLDLMLSR